MLTILRREKETCYIYDLSTDMTVAELFADGT